MCECCSSIKTTVSMNNKRRPKSRKAKKPKFLSLRHQFPPTQPDQIKSSTTDSRQLNLFPLHPENDQDQAENVALFFSAADGAASTLTGLLDNSHAAESISDNNSSRVDYLSPSSASLTYASMEERAALVRNALRSRDRNSSEEKWVCYSEVVERKVKEEEVTSSAVDRRAPAMGPMSLKLDYEEIMNAWSNKGPLYIDAVDSCSQIVPDVNYDFLPHDGSNNNGMCNVGLWRVPEMVGDEEEIKSVGSREASVLRYKEKRRNRLFSKKIRYQVRKLNAESRPRLKGRFVKRS